jgi:lipid-binding SYLF domain-containing protein
VVASQAKAQGVPPFEANTREAAIVDSSAQVLNEIMQIPAQGIPRSLLTSAEGLVIVPGILKGGFVIGVERGRGVVLVRDENGNWQLPQFVVITGGSIGWQAGVQATDLVLVFKSKRSVQGLLTGKFTVGVDAAAAAGPVGREMSAATDAKLQAEIYSYSRSRGLFAGFSVDGAKIDLDRAMTDAYYRPMVPAVAGQAAPVPASSLRLMQVVGHYTMKPTVDAPGAAAPVAAAPAADAQAVCRQLAASSQRLTAIVDQQWKGFLALPAETYSADRLPTREAVTDVLARYQSVVGRPEYAALTSRPEFTETLQLLQQLLAAMPTPTVSLPAPPTR